ncbi:tRNA (adenosine(37)-N6)-threonylcarbamoyltransferase complex dimerization subunit type 1 TsaB [Cellulophaga omnivescoria]|uniref:tRNA (adenosine(37)-N6)-threonylcarbamoyltransferase complex dimerization subunit type 1 TsaB n=1 Tax=Cellulophaga omnivescoria TaxID=1888890 RepID=UPI000986F209|nr:tRNA (adenosine(37)-N6)-threonylcarbamoyltransferase complex dimerization subunit type 1 TsaB [Cellulophaga omnivescoria]WBU88087.1 tRNA (adenosine(37)-N6)-threonylcarbamoyltransferase complex dimerization subunit type 1 TsaB [Cellulophaga omnivescoria]WKB80067.1 tRNA (adenosine(37)-N6)-threonylcarbamoyltransferase complex dimerization subunit type 1 TsaB [Cellulophaga lytica]
MAIILNIETATTNCSVSVAKDGKMLALKEFNSASFSHAEQLHIFIEDVLKEASLLVADINAIAVSKGPGSYTGLRIGVSAAKGLCFSLDIPLISVATLSSLAHQTKPKENEAIVAVLDARRMEVYSAVFTNDFNQIKETEAIIIDETSYSDVLGAYSKVHFVGSGAEKIKNTIQATNTVYILDAVPSAKEMCALSFVKFKNLELEDVAYFEPYYLKDFVLQKPKPKK